MSASSLAEVVPAVERVEKEWSLATRVAFRFCFAFLLLYNVPGTLAYVPMVGGWALKPWNWLVPRVAKSLFGVEAVQLANGSGDKTWDYVHLFLIVAIASSITLVWSIVDRRAESYPRLHHGLRVYIRFVLAMVMISYGAVKVIPSQFPAPTLDRLIQPFGQASPMGLLWTFMGASVPYVIFTGLAEVLGGLLLTTRRTALAGALISAGVMGHVTVMNFCYDVPVKLFASMLLFMSLFLIAPDAKRLASFFLLAGPPRAAWWKVALRTAAVLAFLAYSINDAVTTKKEYGELKSPLRGIWYVDQLKVDGVDQPPLLTNGARWRRMVFDNAWVMSIQLVSDERLRFRVELDEKKKSLVLTKRGSPANKSSFTYQRPDPGTLIVDGTMDGKTFHAAMRLEPEEEFLLMSRGFHWVNEMPFNR